MNLPGASYVPSSLHNPSTRVKGQGVFLKESVSKHFLLGTIVGFKYINYRLYVKVPRSINFEVTYAKLFSTLSLSKIKQEGEGNSQI